MIECCSKELANMLSWMDRQTDLCHYDIDFKHLYGYNTLYVYIDITLDKDT